MHFDSASSFKGSKTTIPFPFVVLYQFRIFFYHFFVVNALLIASRSYRPFLFSVSSPPLTISQVTLKVNLFLVISGTVFKKSLDPNRSLPTWCVAIPLHVLLFLSLSYLLISHQLERYQEGPPRGNTADAKKEITISMSLNELIQKKKKRKWASVRFADSISWKRIFQIWRNGVGVVPRMYIMLVRRLFFFIKAVRAVKLKYFL